MGFSSLEFVQDLMLVPVFKMVEKWF